MNLNEILNKEREFIVENFMFGDDDGYCFNNETSFLQSGIIDSTGILELIYHLEEDYGLEIRDEEVIPENLDSLKKIAEYVQRKTN